MKLLLFVSVLLLLQLSAKDAFLEQFFNKQLCDRVLENDGLYKTCYSDHYKGAKYIAFSLDGKLVNESNIEKRPRFYDDLNIPKQFRSTYADYANDTYQRGHIFEDASADYSVDSLKAVYRMSNIVPMEAKVNMSKSAWSGVERYGRMLATKFGNINVLNGIVYNEKPKRIGRNKIAVPFAFWKMYYKSDGYQRCFYLQNNSKAIAGKKLKEHEVDCGELLKSEQGVKNEKA
jgi:endonuclease G